MSESQSELAARTANEIAVLRQEVRELADAAERRAGIIETFVEVFGGYAEDEEQEFIVREARRELL